MARIAISCRCNDFGEWPPNGTVPALAETPRITAPVLSGGSPVHRSVTSILAFVLLASSVPAAAEEKAATGRMGQGRRRKQVSQDCESSLCFLCRAAGSGHGLHHLRQ